MCFCNHFKGIFKWKKKEIERRKARNAYLSFSCVSLQFLNKNKSNQNYFQFVFCHFIRFILVFINDTLLEMKQCVIFFSFEHSVSLVNTSKIITIRDVNLVIRQPKVYYFLKFSSNNSLFYFKVFKAYFLYTVFAHGR